MRLSVIIPVYNEQGSINSTIKRVKSISECEIIVSDANTETLKVINDKSIKCVTSSKGRGNQMNAGAQSASGDVFLFLHADTVLPDNFEDEISKALLTHQAGAFRLSISSGKPVFRIVEKLVHITAIRGYSAPERHSRLWGGTETSLSWRT